jgi:hypothetical protein
MGPDLAARPFVAEPDNRCQATEEEGKLEGELESDVDCDSTSTVSSEVELEMSDEVESEFDSDSAVNSKSPIFTEGP